MKYRLSANRAKSDPEKMVLPAVVFINTNHEAFTNLKRKGFMICIGWWDWSIKFSIIK